MRLTLLTLVLWLAALPASAQYARAYANLPKDSSVIEVSTSNTASNTWLDDSIATRMESRSNTFIFTYVYTIPGIKSRAAGIGVVLPVTSLLSYDATTNVVTQNADGAGDLSFTIDHNFYGAKAMSREEFMRTAATSYGGLHAVMSVPSGSYDATRPTNIGSNRSTLKLTYNQSFTWDKGKSWLDFYGNARWFSDNKEYNGTNTLSQDTLFGFESHYSRNVGARVWMEGGLIWAGGGATQVDQSPAGASQDNWKAIIGASTKTWKGGSLILNYTQTVYHPVNTPRTRTWMLLFMHVI